MNLTAATAEAFRLLVSGNPELWQIIGVTLFVSITGLVIATPFAVWVGYAVATQQFIGRRALVVVLQALLSFPTVVVGLFVYLLLTRNGPFGSLQWLFTQKAMIVGEAIIAFPVLAAFTLAAVQAADPRLAETATVLGASRWRTMATVLFECRFGVMAAIVNGFGRVIAEVGSALMVGGNIAGATRTITTAIALETSKGEFAQGIALGAVLIVFALFINVALALLQGRGGLRAVAP